MKIFIIMFLCLFFAAGAFAQTEEKTESPAAVIEEITLMRDDGEGNAGEETDVFKITDVPIHCQILLGSFKPAIVKMNLIAVEVKGLKAGMKVLSVSYKTNGNQNIVAFRGSPQKTWLAGKYRAEVFVDDKLAGKKEFEIQKSAALKDKQINAEKPKTIKAPRKN